MTVTTFYLIRHGETPSNRDRHFNTYTTPLSPAGEAQAARVAEWLAGQAPFHALYASDLTRTVATAATIRARLGLPLQTTPAIRELDTGDFKGIPYAVIDARHPGFMTRWVDSGGRERLPGGESVGDVAARALDWLRVTAPRHAGERVLAVSHGWTLSILLAHAHGWDPHDTFAARRISLGNTAVSVVEVDAGGDLRCLSWGATDHLDSPALPSTVA